MDGVVGGFLVLYFGKILILYINFVWTGIVFTNGQMIVDIMMFFGIFFVLRIFCTWIYF